LGEEFHCAATSDGRQKAGEMVVCVAEGVASGAVEAVGAVQEAKEIPAHVLIRRLLYRDLARTTAQRLAIIELLQ
jgi:hypothetical protein